jgi:hypothetical protein
MTTDPALDRATTALRATLTRARANDSFQRKIRERDEVLGRYRTAFSPDRVDALSKQDFLSFLNFKNNKHWTGLHRRGPDITKDMARLRKALGVLLDEKKPVEERLDRLEAGEPDAVPQLGKGILTPVLMVAQPERYGVWNQIAENGLKSLAIWPQTAAGSGLGKRYAAVNGVLRELAGRLGVDFWTLDWLLWHYLEELAEGGSTDGASLDGTQDAVPVPAAAAASAAAFGLEQHLQDFLVENWEHTELGKDWDLLVEGGETVGSQYPAGNVGRIDLLAKHKREPRYLVVELKREQSTDQTLGQLLRYMGWAKKHLVKNGERVEGLIIARTDDERIRYALECVADVELLQYEVDFHLRRRKGQ